ncbi:MAG: glutaredoxin domain-containing protein [Candidatus Diapherotrites archaeon]
MNDELETIRKKKIAEMLSKMSKPKIKIYTTSSCPYCHTAKEFLKQIGVKFEEVNVEFNQKAANEMIEKSGQMGVPVIDINRTIVVGFNKEVILKALK